MELSNFDSPMIRQAMTVPDLIQNQFEDLEPKSRKLFTFGQLFSFKRIILTGCGDSYAAALAAKDAFETYANVPVEVVSAINLSRHYEQKFLSDGSNSPLVIAVSSSGKVARLVEAVIRVGKLGASTLAVTKDRHSPLAKHASHVYLLDPPGFEPSPGVGSYAVSVLALLLLAVRFGEVKSVIPPIAAGKVYSSFCENAEKLKNVLPQLQRQVFSIAERWKNFSGYDFIGSGIDFSTVYYGHAKIIEACGAYAMYNDTEEWLHLNFFVKHAVQTGTVFVISRDNPAMSRGREVIRYLQENRRPTIIITDDNSIAEAPDIEIIRLPAVSSTFFVPLTQMIPAAMLAGYLSSLNGEVYGRGAVENWAFCKDGKAVQESDIITV